MTDEIIEIKQKAAQDAFDNIVNSLVNEFTEPKELMHQVEETISFLLYVFVCEVIKKEHLLDHVKNQQKHFLECIKEFLKKTSH